MTTWPSYREPLRTTILRTGAIAVAVGMIVAVTTGGGLDRWPIWTLLVLWFSFGGHWVEVWFLHWLRPRIPAARGVQIAARVATWFVAGIGLTFGMKLTAAVISSRPMPWPAWWVGGLAFVGVELLAHLPLRAMGRPSFYNGRG